MKAFCKVLFLLFINFEILQAQVKSVNELDKKYLNWYNLDYTKDQILGTSVDKAYNEFLRGKKPKKTIVVAVIDSGVDIDHEDLVDKIWVNKNEIPNNKIDDDKNGYVDDINGWNFLGNSKGENLHYENLEYTRIYKSGGGENFLAAKKKYEDELKKRSEERDNLLRFEKVYNEAKAIIKDKSGIEVHSLNDLNNVSSIDQSVLKAKEFLSSRYKLGLTEESLKNMIVNNREYLNTFLNPDLNSRIIIGDDPENINDINYGNPDVKGPRSDHGTSVAGVVAATRNNNLGTNGIAEYVKIMVLRSTPRGDERDKDVALAIRYAVENGADIINMSFGKTFSPQKKFIDDAVRLAEERNVLIVHGSGNGALNIDMEEMYPSDRYIDKSEPVNWMNIGATSMKVGEETVSKFSNYGKVHVDLFAPGEDIILLDSASTYTMQSGTSLSAPVVTGIAALVLSYFPELRPQELIDILLSSSYKLEKQKVKIPDFNSEKRKRTKFGELSKSGGIVNAYDALKLANERSLRK
jgi:subtilisin family serine protease